jgi:hypothetical protein
MTSLVMREVGWMSLAGSLMGGPLSYLAMRLVTRFLYGVKPHDTATIGNGYCRTFGRGVVLPDGDALEKRGGLMKLMKWDDPSSAQSFSSVRP